MPDILQSAIAYADLGYHVFPCVPNEKKPLTAHGLKDATTDQTTIEGWWSAAPNANLGVETAGLLIVDIDGPDNQWLANEPEKLLTLADAPLSLTAGGGKHYWFRDLARRFRNTAGKLGHKVDTRAAGGYVVVPPSVTAAGSYRWASVLDVGPEALPEPPQWLVDMLDGGGNLPSVRSSQVQAPNAIPSGSRNDTLARLAGSMRRVGMSQAAIEVALQQENQTRCSPPLPAREIKTIAESISRYESDPAAVASVEGQGAIEAEQDGEADPGPVDSRLLRVPGFVDDVMQFTLSTAPYPEPVLAFGGALSLQAFLASRKVRDTADNRTSLYVLGLANSGAGKDHPRKINQRILLDAGLADCLGDTLASGEGLEDAILAKPSLLCQVDELDNLLTAIKHGNDVRHEGIMNVLLRLYTSAGSLYTMRLKAGKERMFIDQPALTLYGTAIPQRFYESMAMKMLTNGFFARLLILEAGPRGMGQDALMQAIPGSIKQVANWWAGSPSGNKNHNLDHLHPIPRTIEQTAEAATVLNAFRDLADREYATAETRENEASMAIWARANEKVRRLALNYACSSNHEKPLIGADAARWACEFIEYQTRRMLFMAGAHVSENDFDAKGKRVLEVLRKWQKKHGGDWMPFWQVNRKTKGWTSREHEDVRRSLLSQGVIEYELANTGGRPGECYRLRRGAI